MRLNLEREKTPTLRQFLLDFKKRKVPVARENYWVVERIFFSKYKWGVVLVTKDWKVTLDGVLSPWNPDLEYILSVVQNDHVLLAGGFENWNPNSLDLEAEPTTKIHWRLDDWGLVCDQWGTPPTLTQLELFPEDLDTTVTKPLDEEQIARWKRNLNEWARSEGLGRLYEEP